MRITINLQKSTDAKGFNPKEDELVHVREFERVKSWIETRIKFVDELGKSKEKSPRMHDTISVLGARGTGKTSFLLSIKDYYETDTQIQVLKIIDPTLIEEKGHVFLNIISLIKETIENKIDKNNADPKSDEYQKGMIWRRKMASLAQGLPSLDGIGAELTSAEWQDPEYIMNRGITAVTSARKLEDNFNDLVAYALDILDKSAFLLVLDDIDVSFTRGWPVLETIRKYLTSPQIITILSGDFRLYSLAVRKQQWKNFGKGLLINEGELLNKLPEYNRVVTELEGQYLKKVLKPERRIHLPTLGDKLRVKNNNRRDNTISIKDSTSNPNYIASGEYEIFISSDEKDQSADNIIANGSIVFVYNAILEQFGIKNSYQADTYRSYLLNLPLRTQIRLLSIFISPNYETLQHSISDVFLSELYDKKVPVSIVENMPQFLSPAILDLLIREKQLGETYQLQPITTDDGLNACLVALSFIYSDKIRNYPFLIFEYFIKIGYVRNLVDSLGYQGDRDNRDRNENSRRLLPSVEGLCRHAALSQDKVLRDSAALMISYMMSVRGTTRMGVNQPEGSLQLKGLSELGRRGDVNRIDAIFKETDLIQGIIISLPVSISKIAQRQDTKVVYSIYTLLGAIAELIRKDHVDDLDNGLLELSQMRQYNAPDFERSIDDGDNSEDMTTANDDKLDPKATTNSLKRLIRTWIAQYNLTSISPHLLGKISTRMFYAFGNIISSKPQNAAEGMHRMVTAFMNSVLVEEAKENLKETSNININNTITSDSIFLNNLEKLRVDKESLPFSSWIISCPILLAYLSPETIKTSRFSAFVNEEVYAGEPLQLSVYKSLLIGSTVYLEEKIESRQKKRGPVLPEREIRTNKDFYNYCKSRGIPFDFIMNTPTKDFEKVFKTSPKFFDVKNKDVKLRNFRRYIKKERLTW